MKKIYDTFRSNRALTLHRGDCLDLLKTLPDSAVDITITSPPYCMGKDYEQSNDLSDFRSNHEAILPEVIRATKDGGSICWQVGYHVKDGVLSPLDFLVHDIMSRHPAIKLRNRIIWTFGHGVHCRQRFSGRHEVILWYTKGDQFTFDLDSVRIPQKYPGKLYYKGPHKGKPSSNPKGKNPGDVWDFPNVKANHIEKTLHPCQFPIAIANRLIKALSPKNGLIMDPFAGSGTTAAASILNGRRFVGAEVNAVYYNIALNRMNDAQNGNLRYRPEDLPIHVPKPSDSVARRPIEFEQSEHNGQIY